CVPELPPAVPGVVPVPNGSRPEGPEGGTPDKPDTTTSAKFVSAAQAKPGPAAQPKPPQPMTFAEYYMAVPRLSRDQVITNARRALEMGRQIGFGMSAEAIQADADAA